jgi:STAS domain
VSAVPREFLTQEGDRVRLRGAWLMANGTALAAALDSLGSASRDTLTFDASGLDEIDLGGAVLLDSRLRALEKSGVRVAWQGRPPDPL